MFDFEIDKKVKTAIIALVVIALIAVVAFNCVFTVNEQEKAVVLTFGNPTYVKESGLGFKIPFIQSVQKVNTTIQGFAIGYDETTSKFTPDATMITSDYNFVNVDFFVEWSVTDPIKSLYNSQSPQAILSNIVQSSARSVIGVNQVDSVLTTGKGEIQSLIKANVSDALEKLDIGVQVHNITIQDAEPPTVEIMTAFDAVEDARQKMDTYTNDANKYKNEQIPAARAEADKLLRDAEADKESRINEAKGEVARFNELFAEYEKNKEVTKKRMFYEAMETIMPEIELIIGAEDGSTQSIYPVKSFTEGGAN
ncbi:MAG: FtsH protease activity modulator HflK [Ruminococcaceae bacterium]|nr:FtsH protease activity modulator HflK [Oscillospiraceae bacterium]